MRDVGSIRAHIDVAIDQDNERAVTVSPARMCMRNRLLGVERERCVRAGECERGDESAMCVGCVCHGGCSANVLNFQHLCSNETPVHTRAAGASLTCIA